MNAPIVADKYQLLRKLGQGGMAEVYLAKQTGQGGFEKLVVIKRILPGLSANREFVTMFLDEARTAADLRHPNVVNIFEIGEDQGVFYMVMEFLHGQDIRRIQRKAAARQEMLPLQHACQIVLDAAAGLHYAHTKSDLRGQPLNIVHRDVSPQNILVTYDGATKIVDFGIAKAASQSVNTATGIIKGKYTYMSPEQAQGEVIDARSDQYALGIVFWELLTMRRLFKRESEIKTLNAIVDGEVPSPRVYVPDLPVHLEHIVLQCLAKDPNDRFDSCEDLMLELEDFLADEGLVHSPARLGQYMRGLFADTLAEEAALGAGQLDGESFSSHSLPAGDVTQKGRRGTAKSRSVRVEVDVEDADAPDAKTAFTSSRKAEPVVVDEERSEPTGVTGDVAAARATDEDEATTATSFSRSDVVLEVAPPPRMPVGSVRDEPRRPVWFYAALGAVGGLVALVAVLALLLRGEPVGGLELQSTPMGASVFLDGAETGRKTPTRIGDLAPGAHQVRLVLEGHAPFDASVFVVEDEDRRLSASLRPARAAITGGLPAVPGEIGAPIDDGPRETNETNETNETQASKDASRPEVAVEEPEKAKREAAAQESAAREAATRDDKRGERQVKKERARRASVRAKPARLRIVVKPWGEVYIDGKQRGITPMKPLKLPPGTYKVRLKNPDLGKDVTETITLEAGDDKLIRKEW